MTLPSSSTATADENPAQKPILRRSVPALGAVAGFFALKILVGVALVTQSAHALSVAGFAEFSQLFLFLALLSTVAAGGVQNGLIRQVAAAGDDQERERRATAAAVVIWGCFGLTMALIATLGARMLSIALVGDVQAAGTIPVIAAAALASGGGQLLCAILTGRQRAAASLSLQAAGLVVGGGACWWRLASGDAQGAVIAYAAGPIVTFVAALPLSWRWLPIRAASFKRLGPELRVLMGFSGAFLTTAAVMPATLFALRFAYRLEFGPEALGYWLAANRVSDVTSQLLGLYMAQVYLPAAARSKKMPDARRLAGRTLLIGVAAMGSGLAMFVLFAPWLVRTFLSSAFIPAIPFIVGYLAGDTFRVVTSLALHTALARGRLSLYVGVETVTAALIALYVLALTAAGRPESAYWGYVLAQATMAGVLWIAWRRMSNRAHGSVGG